MSASDALIQRASGCGVIPTLVIEDVNNAVPLAQALRDGGLTVLEITLRTPVALQAIQQIRQALPDLWVGAGTVLDERAAEAAHAAGAQFLVSPGYTTALGDYCRSKQIALMPGVATASEIMAALADSYDFLKCFPAAVLGGTRWLEAMRGPFPDVSFCPTGGISAVDARAYLSLPNVLCIGGSWVTPAAAVREKDWGKITTLARQAFEARNRGT
jgi:2-dehydro-3-deoxyphosphogluconate aldolase/(4S)-4-hydroxy-2-oxoglutarate aldolase